MYAEMYAEWMAMEHYRLHTVERWPDSPAKAAQLAAIRATIAGLHSAAPGGTVLFDCFECAEDVRPSLARAA